MKRASIVGITMLLGAAAADASEPWTALAELRAALERQPFTAEFVQVYVPAGFSSGESQGGRIVLALPGAVRWDYADPYPNSFLISAGTAWSWNEGDQAGRRHVLNADELRDLELLRLDVEALRQRYEASLDSDNDISVVTLTPREAGAPVARAALRFDPSGPRLVGLAYDDPEGNATRFDLRGHRPLETPSLLEPPAGLSWLDE